MVDKFGLNEKLYNAFIKLQETHNNAWESNERKDQHSLKNIEKVEYNSSEGLFYVYYKETEHFGEVWYHYDTEESTWW